MNQPKGITAFFTWRWATAFAVTCLLSALCVGLGNWQWERRAERVAKNNVVTQNYDRPPIPLTTALTIPDMWSPQTQWTPVTLTGSYIPDTTVLIRSRPMNKTPGFFVTDQFADNTSGLTVVVNRGWVPTGNGPDGLPDRTYPPATGPNQLTGYLRSADAWIDTPTPQGQSLKITPANIAPGEDTLTPGYVVLGQENTSRQPTPLLLPRPITDEGPHLSYSMQWYVFAGGCFIGLFIAARRSETWEKSMRSTTPTRTPRKRPTAEDEEDALVDAYLQQHKQ